MSKFVWTSCLVCFCFVLTLGCGGETTGVVADDSELAQYLDENPAAAATDWDAEVEIDPDME